MQIRPTFVRVTRWNVGLMACAATPYALGETRIGNGCESEHCELFSVREQQIIPPKPEMIHGIPVYDPSTPTLIRRCVKSADLPKSVYKVVTQMIKTMKGNPSDPSGVPVVLSPAQQTMLLFYNTIATQTKTLTCGEGK